MSLALPISFTFYSSGFFALDWSDFSFPLPDSQIIVERKEEKTIMALLGYQIPSDNVNPKHKNLPN